MLSIIFFIVGFITASIFLMIIYYLRKHKEYHVYVMLQEKEAMVIERLGKFHRVIFSGFHILFPLFDRPRTMYWRFPIDPRTGEPGPVKVERKRIDLRETVYDFPEQKVITSDNAYIIIDGFILVRIIDPKKVVYAVENFPGTIENLVESSLRDVIAGMTLEETLVSRDKINYALRGYLKNNTSMWGVEIITAEIKNITPDKEVFESMKLQSVEERKKFAAGHRAQAERITLEEVIKVLGSKEAASQYVATLKYVDAFKELVTKKDGKVVFVPYESGNLISSLGIIKELFEGTKGEQKYEK